VILISNNPLLEFCLHISGFLFLKVSFLLVLTQIIFLENSHWKGIVILIKCLSLVSSSRRLNKIVIFNFSLNVLLKLRINFVLFVANNLEAQEGDYKLPASKFLLFWRWFLYLQSLYDNIIQPLENVFHDFLVFFYPTIYISTITIVDWLN